MTQSNSRNRGPSALQAYSRPPRVSMPTFRPIPLMAAIDSTEPGNGTASETNSHSHERVSSSISL